MRPSWTTRFSQRLHVFTRRLSDPVIVTEQRADPVDLVHHAFDGWTPLNAGGCWRN
jgi:hypothetical protein